MEHLIRKKISRLKLFLKLMSKKREFKLRWNKHLCFPSLMIRKEILSLVLWKNADLKLEIGLLSKVIQVKYFTLLMKVILIVSRSLLRMLKIPISKPINQVKHSENLPFFIMLQELLLLELKLIVYYGLWIENVSILL